MVIHNFSAWYGGYHGHNAITNKMSSQALAYAQGLAGPEMLEGQSTGNAVLDADFAKVKRQQQRALQNNTKKKSKPTKKKQPTKKKPVSKKRKAETLVPALPLLGDLQITCDGCQEDCTAHSYFITKTEEDYCPVCYAKLPKSKKTNSERHANGANVGKKKKKQKK